MYKVITHTIREEHFTHPATADYALSGGHMGNVKAYGTAITGDFSSGPAIVYRGWLRTAMETYVSDLRSELVSIYGTGEETPLLEQRIVSAIEEWVGMMRPYYNTNVTTTLKQALTDYTMDLIDHAKAHKEGRSVTDIETRLNQHIKSIADFMAVTNPHWSKTDAQNYFTWFAEAFKNQCMARKDKKWAEDQDAYNYARQVFLTGLPDVAGSLCQFIAKGVIAQFPGRFR